MNKQYLAMIIRRVKDSDTIQAAARGDDAQAGLFARQLVTVTFSELFRHEFPDTKWMNGGLIPINTAIDEGAKEYSFVELEDVGMAEVVADNADDLPEADNSGKNNVREIKTIGVSVSYSTQELRTARLQGLFDLASEKARAAREANDRRLDQLIRTGAPSKGLFGVVNQPGIIVAPAITGSWQTAAANLIIADVSAAINALINESDGIETPDTVLFDVRSYTRLSTLPFDPTSGPMTVLAFLKQAFPMITRWDWEPGLKNVSPSSGPVMLVYRNDASRMRAVFPMMMRALPPEQRGLKIKLGFETRFGGIMTPRPRSVFMLTGV